MARFPRGASMVVRRRWRRWSWFAAVVLAATLGTVPISTCQAQAAGARPASAASAPGVQGNGAVQKTEAAAADDPAVQLRATVATERQADFALVAAVLSLVGTFLLVLTLEETRRSARAAERAADASIASAKAATQAIERSQRPFLVVSRVYAEGGPLKPPSEGENRVLVKVENVGEVHAFVEGFGAGWAIGPAGMPLGSFAASGDASIDAPLIGPKSLAEFPVDRELTAELFDQQAPGRQALHLQGFVTYRSPTGGRYTTSFCWKYGTHGPGFVPDPFNTLNWTESADPDYAAKEHKVFFEINQRIAAEQAKQVAP